jgi:hypothetical protein
MSPHETKQVEDEPLEELFELDVHEVTVVAATTYANTASCGNCPSAECAERGAV